MARYGRPMPGSRPSGFLFGASAEDLAKFVLGTFAFVTPVPYPVDVGHDFHCVLHRRAADRRTLRAGPAFSVQVKSGEVPPYEAGPAAEWLADQESPLFLCLVDRPNLTCAIYSTWNVHNAHLLHGPLRTVLEPDAEFSLPRRVDDTLYVPLGPPVLRLRPDDVVGPVAAARCADILEPWILIERQIIVGRRAGMFWVEGPAEWTTNQPLASHGQKFIGEMYRNPKNLARCVRNLVRSAVAARRVIDMYQDQGHLQGWPQAAAIDDLLAAFAEQIRADPLADRVMRRRAQEQAARAAAGTARRPDHR